MGVRELIKKAQEEAEIANAKAYFYYPETDEPVDLDNPREEEIYVTFTTLEEGDFTDSIQDLYGE